MCIRDRGYHSQASASTVDIIKGLEYACEKGAKVINMCLGHSVGDSDLYGVAHDDVALEAAVNDAVYNRDVVITCSAGNKDVYKRQRQVYDCYHILGGKIYRP